MAITTLEAGLAALAQSRRVSQMMFEDIPDGKWLHQPCKDGNHALWIMGHIANCDECFMAELGDRPKDNFKKWEGMFFMKSTPTTDAKAYPPLAEVKAAYGASREALVSWFKSMSPAQLESPLPEGWGDFAKTYAALMQSIAWHEGLHTGQLTVVRKSLGLAPKLG